LGPAIGINTLTQLVFGVKLEVASVGAQPFFHQERCPVYAENLIQKKAKNFLLREGEMPTLIYGSEDRLRS
jgi:hypothetical protein